MMSAALATSSMGRDTAMKTMSTAETSMLQCGVRRFLCTLLRRRGRADHRPDPDQGRVHETHLAGQADFGVELIQQALLSL